MFFKRAILSSAAAFAAVFAVASAPAHANMLTNGNFSTTGAYSAPGYSAVIPGWTQGGTAGATPSFENGGDFWDNGNDYGNPASDTVGFIQGAGTLSQSVTLLANEKYTLSFAYNARQFTANPNLVVTVGGVTVDTITSIAPVNAYNTYTNGFDVASFTFTEVAAGSKALVFSDSYTGGDSAVLLDDVVLNDAGPASSVPEPGSMALLGAGLLGMVMVARRRRV
jgi:hypothetical protein